MLGKIERGIYKVYVGNFGNNGLKKELEREFERFGRFYDVWVVRNFFGFVFVEFMEYYDVEDVCKLLDGVRICGERVRVEMVRNRNRGGGGGGGGFRRFDYRDDRYGGGGRYYDNRGGFDRYDDRLRLFYRCVVVCLDLYYVY